MDVSLGNHESDTLNQMYGFVGEVREKYSSTMYDLFAEVYNWLPLAHVINEKVLVSCACVCACVRACVRVCVCVC